MIEGRTTATAAISGSPSDARIGSRIQLHRRNTNAIHGGPNGGRA
ncbi:hypothetical protein [Natrinema sp. CBA1119]|nr:hypothetical protein [Natrinema sp. CBA1119]